MLLLFKTVISEENCGMQNTVVVELGLVCAHQWDCRASKCSSLETCTCIFKTEAS